MRNGTLPGVFRWVNLTSVSNIFNISRGVINTYYSYTSDEELIKPTFTIVYYMPLYLFIYFIIQVVLEEQKENTRIIQKNHTQITKLNDNI